ncbi:Putative Pol polyprotein, partial [Chaetura pelagica]
QWPMTRERRQITAQLVQEQLQQDHIKPSTSPWNTPIFVIPKKSGKWRLLHDLRKVNEQMWPMGALQSGMPLPTMLPVDWNITIIDLKDCFFTIPLQPQDTCHFAFTLKSINKESPDLRYEWTVLPQGMHNSPTMCQLYVGWALQPVRLKYSDMLIYHCMDDILFCSPDNITDDVLQDIVVMLGRCSLVVAPEKIQRTPPWQYLGWTIYPKTVQPQKPLVVSQIKTLADVQKPAGDLQWLRPLTGLTNADLAPFTALLRG